MRDASGFMIDGYCDASGAIMQCLGAKILTRYAILKAELEAKGEWKEEYEAADGVESVGEELGGMSIFEYEERYGEDAGNAGQ